MFAALMIFIIGTGSIRAEVRRQYDTAVGAESRPGLCSGQRHAQNAFCPQAATCFRAVKLDHGGRQFSTACRVMPDQRVPRSRR